MEIRLLFLTHRWYCQLVLGWSLVLLTSVVGNTQDSVPSGEQAETRGNAPPVPASVSGSDAVGVAAEGETPPVDGLDPELLELEELLSTPAVAPGETPGTLTELAAAPVAASGQTVAPLQRTVPAAVTRIDSEMIWQSGARSLNELFDIHVPNLQTITMVRQGEKIGIRGIISNNNDKFLLKVNGKIMNDRTRAGAFTELDLPMLGDIHHIDVVRGPGSMIDGPGAIAGVINIQTHTGLTFQGLDATVRQGIMEAHTTAEVRYGLQIDEDTGLFVYYGLSDYAGADRDDAPFIYGSSFIARDGSFVIAGQPAPPGVPVPNAHQAYRSQVKHKLHINYTDGNLDVWARLTANGETVGTQRQTVIDPPSPGFPGFAGRSELSAGSEQFTVGSSYLLELSDTFDLDMRLTYDTSDYVLTAPAGNHSSHREDEVYTRLLGRWTPNEEHAVAFGYAFSHEWFGERSRGFPGTAPIIVGLNAANAGPWQTNTHSLMGEYQFQIGDEWTGFAGVRTDKHTYTDWLVSPRAALVWTPNEQDTFKGIWTTASRRNGDGVLRNTFLNTGGFAEIEEIESAELRYEARPCEHWLLASGFFWQQIQQITFSPAQDTQALLGTFDSAGIELEASYRDEDTQFNVSHAYTQLINGVLLDVTQRQGVTAEPYGFGNDLAGWSPHITKLYLAHDLNEDWTASSSLRVYWGFPGDEDLADYNRSIGNQNNLPVTDPGFRKPWHGSYFLDFGLERKMPCGDGVVRLDLYNVLGWIDKDLNKRNMLRRASWRNEAAAVGLSTRWEF